MGLGWRLLNSLNGVPTLLAFKDQAPIVIASLLPFIFPTSPVPPLPVRVHQGR